MKYAEVSAPFDISEKQLWQRKGGLEKTIVVKVSYHSEYVSECEHSHLSVSLVSAFLVKLF